MHPFMMNILVKKFTLSDKNAGEDRSGMGISNKPYACIVTADSRYSTVVIYCVARQ